MTTPTSNTTFPQRFTVQVSAKGKMRLVDAEVLTTGGEESYQRQYQISDLRSFRDGKAIIQELRLLCLERQEKRKELSPEEVTPFLEDIEAVLTRGWTEMNEFSFGLAMAKRYLNRWMNGVPTPDEGNLPGAPKN